MQVNRQELLERFLRYVRIETTANADTERYPSSDGQRVLGRMLAEELTAMGAIDVQHDAHGLVYATVPATVTHAVPVVAWNAHVDTSPETTAKNVNPQVIESYAGGDIVLPGDTRKVIRMADSPELDGLMGCTLITTDGRTLLGGDDKAGVAIIMQAVSMMLANAQRQHGMVRVLFTCDEEIGRGVDHVDLKKLGAEVAYTLDGPAANVIDVETFSADLAVVTIEGVNIHPAIAKDRMVNAIRAAAHLVDQLPRDMAPETTEGREPFLHPYGVQGGVDRVTLKVLLRSFATADLSRQADLLRRAADTTLAAFPGSKVDIEVTPQYRNMAEGLTRDPRVVEYAEEAHQRLGRESKREIIRGGTDGSRLTELGLPTPNLSSGQHNLHSYLEWACLDEMVQSVEVLLELATVWAERSR